MKKLTTPDEKPHPPAIELWDRSAVLRFFGGSAPLHYSTLYRGVRNGIFPEPINVSSGRNGSVRWLRSECEAALHKMIAERDNPTRTKPRRGRRPNVLRIIDTIT